MDKHKLNTPEKAKLEHKVALITGGAKRIGACIAQTLHAAGMDIVIHYHASADAARALQAQLNAQREHSCLLIQGDLSEYNKLKSLVEESVLQMGRLDVLVNNASAFYPTPLQTASPENWHQLVDINLKAPFFLTQAAAKHLVKYKGCVINLTDIYAERPLGDHPIYCASKAGLVSLTYSFAQSLAPEIRVNAIAPGAILWSEHEQNEIAQKRLLSRVPLKSPGNPSDIANTALFLIRSPYITGQVIKVDGGRTVMP